jgi:hypothetical protein
MDEWVYYRESRPEARVPTRQPNRTKKNHRGGRRGTQRADRKRLSYFSSATLRVVCGFLPSEGPIALLVYRLRDIIGGGF